MKLINISIIGYVSDRMEKVSKESKNNIQENINKVCELFPEIMVDGKVDFNRLKGILGERIEVGDSYSFSWNGKTECIKLSETTSTGTLLPQMDKSLNWDTTNNVYIEGDNLEVLKILQKSYYKKIKLIYIDPPYNTGNDFVYNDDFQDNLKNYQDKINHSIKKNGESEGRFHTKWLNMMYPRLRLARNLLKEDGVIFISIDHNEMVNLVKICDEIFSADNRLGIISVVNNMKGRSDSAFFATCNEYLICYAKNKDLCSIKGLELSNDELDNDYKLKDEISEYKLVGLRKTGSNWKREDRPFMYYPILYKDGKFDTVTGDEYQKIYNKQTGFFDDNYVENLIKKYESLDYKVIIPKDENGNLGRWRWGLESFFNEKDTNLELNSSGNVCTKMRAIIEDGSIRLKSTKTLWYKPEYDTGSASKILKELFDGKLYFDNPKSLFFMEDIIKISTNSDDYVLDFFSGSSTTAHAVLKLNSEMPNSSRKFIMIQWPEKYSENTDAYTDGYKNICELGEERIRRTIKFLKEQNGVPNKNFDAGFKVYSLNTSNIKVWDGQQLNIDNANEYFYKYIDTIVEGRSDSDLIYEILLKEGLTLTSSIDMKQINDKCYYCVNNKHMIICLNDKIDIELVHSIGKLKPEIVIFKDSGFVDENVKLNAIQELRKVGIEEQNIKCI